MSETLFEPKFKNTYTLTEYIKTHKLIVLIDFKDEHNGMFENLLDLRKIDYFMEHIENEIWQYTFDIKLKDKVEFLIERYNIKVLKIKDI
jgi:hypothetical protein